MLIFVADKWLEACGMSRDPCQNGGYTGANCTCVCPQGTSGSSCEINEQDYFGTNISFRYSSAYTHPYRNVLYVCTCTEMHLEEALMHEAAN